MATFTINENSYAITFVFSGDVGQGWSAIHNYNIGGGTTYWTPTDTGIEYADGSTSVQDLYVNKAASFLCAINVNVTLLSIGTVGGYKYTSQDCDYFLSVDTTSFGGGFSITLPPINRGRTIIVKDSSGQADLYPITIEVSDSLTELIDNASTYTINSPYGSVILTSDANTSKWLITGGGSGGGGGYWTGLTGLGIEYAFGGISALNKVNSYATYNTSVQEKQNGILGVSYYNYNYSFPLPFPTSLAQLLGLTRISIWVEGGYTPYLDSISFGLRGADYTSVGYSIGFYLSTDENFNFATISGVVGVSYAPTVATHTLVTAPILLSPGLNYIWVVDQAQGINDPSSGYAGFYLDALTISADNVGTNQCTYSKPPLDPTGSGFYVNNVPSGQMQLDPANSPSQKYILPDVGTIELGTNTGTALPTNTIKIKSPDAPSVLSVDSLSSYGQGKELVIEGSSGYPGYNNGNITIQTIGTGHNVTTLTLGGVAEIGSSKGRLIGDCSSFETTGARVVNASSPSAASSYSVTTDDYFVGITGYTGGCQVYLPSSPVVGRTLVIMETTNSPFGNTYVNGNGYNIQATGTGAATSTYLISPRISITLLFDGTYWNIIAKN